MDDTQRRLIAEMKQRCPVTATYLSRCTMSMEAHPTCPMLMFKLRTPDLMAYDCLNSAGQREKVHAALTHLFPTDILLEIELEREAG